MADNQYMNNKKYIKKLSETEIIAKLKHCLEKYADPTNWGKAQPGDEYDGEFIICWRACVNGWEIAEEALNDIKKNEDINERTI